MKIPTFNKAIIIGLILIGSPLKSYASDSVFTLKNLERERAAFISSFLDINQKPDQRQAKVKLKERQLVDIERMVMRDERLLDTNSQIVQRAFSDYELTFLVHAGAEKNKNAKEQWLSKVRFTPEQLLNSKVSYR